jgi:hypothetical protein
MKEIKEKDSKERKKTLILSFQIFIYDYYGRGAKYEVLKTPKCRM